MKFTVTIDCDNAAFEDCAATETARILKALAVRLGEEAGGALYPVSLADINGNRVGVAKFTGAK